MKIASSLSAVLAFLVAARPTQEFEEKYGGRSLNAAQWIGRAYVDQKTVLEKRKARKSG